MKRQPTITVSQSLRKLVYAAGLTGTALPVAACDQPIDEDSAIHEVELEDEEIDSLADRQPEGEEEGPARTDADDEIVYASTVVVDKDGKVLRSDTRGALTPAQSRSVARPWTALDDEYLYTSSSSESYDGQGNTTRTFTVVRRPNATPTKQVRSSHGPAQLDEETLKYISEDREAYVLMFRLADFPAFSAPVVPSDSASSPEAFARATEYRQAAIRERTDTFNRTAQPFIEQVRELGGEVVSTFPRPGWVAFKLPPHAVDTMLDSEGFDRAMPGQTEAIDPGWALGRGRGEDRLNGDTFLDNGYSGEQSNPSRHSMGDIVIADIETGQFEDEACAFTDVASCTGSRIRARFRCDDLTPGGDYCESTANFPDNDSNSFHGTAVLSVAAGDYTDGQGDGRALGDSGWVSGAHSSLWENRATGIAPEAGIIMAGKVAGSCTNCGYANAFEQITDEGADIALTEFVFGSGSCDPEATHLYEEALEDAYDDGVFVVSPAGNNWGPSQTSCNLMSPADSVKAFAVNSYDADPSECTQDPSEFCLVDPQYSVRGGLDVYSQGATRSGALRGIDSIAPNRIYSVTSENGAYGTVGSTFVGTSAAGPHVAGLAALVKDWYVDAGNTWINDPGRLFTVMLAMTDRHYSTDPDDLTQSTQQRGSGGSVYYGLGRSKLRLLNSDGQGGSYGNHFRNLSWSSLGPLYRYNPFTSLPAGTDHVKCVAMQHEDMSHKDEVSHIEFRMRLKTSCGGSTTFTRSDTGFDVKKLTAVSANNATLAGRCVEVEVDPDSVTDQGVAISIMCTHSGMGDDE